ncbi:AAA family ATPase [Clostridium sp. YIM B02515]|uniref:AAA family ATPase n=1 Tax=Clostridium rhizosphaerae TaxID=2803861 RepID=A0ABS1TEE4_9CLOT|nr:AAA family ATPase [Clostridium rhizosphaerae]MBL4937740.1 AAA family ATPase [Clostridium rhizosphaerae]
MKGKIYFDKIHNRRIELDITQKEVAEKVGVSISVIKALETGRSDSTVETLEKIAELLGLKLDEVYNPEYRDTKVISVVNNKGGVGKTSVCGSIAYALSEMDYKILCIDADMQMNLTHSLGLSKNPMHLGLAIEKEDDLINYIHKTSYPNIDFIVSDLAMSTTEMLLFTKVERESILKHMLKNIINQGIYDFIIFDTNPVLGILNYNVLNVSEYVIIPIELSIFAIDGLDTLVKYINSIKKTNEKLDIAGIVINKYDLREKKITETCEDIVKEIFGDKIFKTRIGVDTKIKQAQLESIPVMCADTTSRISKQYRDLAKEVVKVVSKR